MNNIFFYQTINEISHLLIHFQNPDPGIWNYYFGSQSSQYDSLPIKNELYKIYKGENIYISNCNFINLHDRAIYVFDLACPNVLISFCFFKDCSTQSEDGGGAFFARICNVIMHFLCAVHPDAPRGGLFAQFFLSKNDFTPQFETSTITFCDSQETDISSLYFYNSGLKVCSSNFTDIKASSTSVLFANEEEDNVRIISINYCSFVSNRAQVQNIIDIQRYDGAFVHRCNFVTNEVTESDSSYCILRIIGRLNQVVESCFYENVANLDISCYESDAVYVINCSFSKGFAGIPSQIKTDEAGSNTFSMNLAHLSSNECKAPIHKTPMKFEANNNNNLKVNVYCSCGMYFPFIRIDSKIIPMFFIPSS